jgi:putative nucleotidyltransferase with HDIG domain
MFVEYTDKFKVGENLPPMLEMKKKHSRRVSRICLAIADALRLDEEGDEEMAYMAGLLHDVGRFKQFKEYGTFNDGESFDHGDAGAEIIANEFDLTGMSDFEIKSLTSAVKHHNKRRLPDTLSLKTYKWAALVRDADKTDIFMTVQKRIDSGKIEEMIPRHTFEGGLSPELVKEIEETGSGSYKHARSLADYRLIQLTWGCDLNYIPTLHLLESEGIFDKIAADLEGFGIESLISSLLKKIRSM